MLRLLSLFVLCTLAAAGCITRDMSEMMDGMGGGRADMRLVDPDPADVGQPADMGPDGEPHVFPPLDGPPLTVQDLSLRGTWQSYHAEIDRELLPQYDHDHPDFPTQLAVQGIRGLHFNLWYDTSNVFFVFNDGIVDMQSRCLYSVHWCFGPIGEWSRANPAHAPIVVLLANPPLYDMPGFDSVLDVLQDEILYSFDRDQIFTMGDLRAFHPELTVREIVTAGLWPPLDTMRGKFLFVLAEPEARRTQREGLWNFDQVPDRLMWVYVDGYSDTDDELGADDAAIAVFDHLEDDDDAARAAEVADRGFLTWTAAHDAPAYARAYDAGVHVIVSKYPDDLFPAPESADWPVSCNPRTAPEGCRTRQIENRALPPAPPPAAR